MHLNAEELVDIAEGARPESAAPHLAACAPCRARLQELRAMMTEVGGLDVPEPSPLFWDHLSSRVSQAVAQDAPRRAWLPGVLSKRGPLGPVEILAVAALLIMAVITPRVLAPAPILSPAPVGVAAPPATAVADASAPAVLLDDAALQDDASLMLVASLTDGVDFDTAREAGLASRESAEHAVTHMNDAELRELRRLLAEELARSGA